MRKQLTILLLLSLTVMMIPRDTVEANILYLQDEAIEINFNMQLSWLNITINDTNGDWCASGFNCRVKMEYIRGSANVIFDLRDNSNIIYFIMLAGYTDFNLNASSITKISINMSVPLMQEYYLNKIYIGTDYGFQMDTISNSIYYEGFTEDINGFGKDIIIEYSFVNANIETTTQTITETEISTSTISTTETSTETQTETNTEIEITTEVITNIDNITNTYDITETWWKDTMMTYSVTRTSNIAATEYTTIVVTSTEDNVTQAQTVIVLGGLGLFLIVVSSGIRYFKKSLKDNPKNKLLKEIWKGSAWCDGCGQNNKPYSIWCTNCGVKL